jgi:hypothetical protein
MVPVDKLPTGQTREQLLQGCKALVFKWATVHLKGYLDKLDDQLLRMADKAGNDLDQHRFLQAQKELRAQRRPLEKQLLNHVRVAFDRYLAREETAAPPAPQESELRLVDNDQLERTIAVAAMVRRATIDCAEALYTLNQRLSVLAGYKVIDSGNPVAPAVFAEALEEATTGFLLDTPSRLVAYKLFDSLVLARLDKLYQLLNHDLKNKGILTHLRYQIDKQRTPELPDELKGLASPESARQQGELMALVRELQSAALQQLGIPAVGQPLPQLVADLQPVQQQSAQALASAPTPQAVLATDYTRLPQQIEQRTRRAGLIDAELISIVGLLFEQVLNDDNLPDSVKALLSYLHTPYLKLALLDRELFNQADHPARQLLNSLVAAGERWVEPDGKHRNDVYQQMKLLVQRVLDELDDDPRLLAVLNRDFNDFLVQYAGRIRRAEERAQQAASGEERLREARQRVDHFLRVKIGNRRLAEPLRTLLFEPWASFLTFNLLRHGPRSEAWKEAATAVDQLLDYTSPRPPRDDGERAALWQERDHLDELLHHGLATVGYDADSGNQLITALHRLHQAALAAPQPLAEPLPVVAADIETIQAPVEPVDDPLLAKVAALEFGTWFIFHADRPKREQLRAKLAWSNRRTQHYMFVNALGQQVAMRRGIELVAGLRVGSVKIESGNPLRPFFERALERIVETLRLRRSPA